MTGPGSLVFVGAGAGAAATKGAARLAVKVRMVMVFILTIDERETKFADESFSRSQRNVQMICCQDRCVIRMKSRICRKEACFYRLTVEVNKCELPSSLHFQSTLLIANLYQHKEVTSASLVNTTLRSVPPWHHTLRTVTMS